MPFPRQRHDGTFPYALRLNPSSSWAARDASQDILPATIAARSRKPRPRRLLLWASLSAAALPSMAQVARARTLRPTNEPTRGAWGWTQGEQTYLRVRPSKNDPIVAKVPHATRVFVWGKFNGWYRVETTDHKFGWVFHDFLKCPKATKVAPLTHAKATSASNRASSQKLYGSASVLQTYYVRHGSKGSAHRLSLAQHGPRQHGLAQHGLAQHGLRLASAPAAKAAAAVKASAAKATAARRIQLTSVKPQAAARPAVRVASRPSMPSQAGRVAASRNAAGSSLRLASASPAQRPFELRPEQVVPDGAAPRLASGAHFGVRQSTREYSPPAYTPRGEDGIDQFNPRPSLRNAASEAAVVPDAVSAVAAARPRTSRLPLRPVPNAPARAKSSARARALSGARPVALRLASRPVPVFEAAPRAAVAASRAVAPRSTRLAAAMPPLSKPAAPVPSAPLSVEASPGARTPLASAPMAVASPQPEARLSQPPNSAAMKPVAARLTAAQVRARARQQRRAWLWKLQQERRSRRLASRGASRDRLRSRMGTAPHRGVPPLFVGRMRPISPEELMRARQSHLAGLGQSAPGTLADAPPSNRTAADASGSGAGGFDQSNTNRDGSYAPAPGGNRDLSPRSDAGAEIPGAYFSLASYSYTPGSAGFAVLRSDDFRATRWAAQQDGPGADAAWNPPHTPQPFALPLSTPAPAAGKRSGSPRGLLWAALAGKRQPAAGRKANVVASRGRGGGTRGGSPRDAYAAGVRGGSPRDAYAAQRRASGLVFGQGVADSALTYRGTPYRSGGASPNGFDCSGLVYFLLRQRGFNPPRTAAGLASFGRPVGKNQLQPGDIVLFANTYKRGVSHVGIYLGNDQFVHAPHTGSRVRTDILFAGYYAAKYYGARRPR